VRNRCSERAVFGFFGIDVNPLMIAGRVSELVDTILLNNEWLTGSKLSANEIK
jgi:hypothetical protein